MNTALPTRRADFARRVRLPARPLAATLARSAALLVLAPSATVSASASTATVANMTGDAGSLLPGEDRAGSTKAANPTSIGVGSWRGTLGPSKAADGVAYYSYDRTMEDSTVLVSVTGLATSPDAEGGDLGVSVETQTGDSCDGSTATQPYGSTGTYSAVVSVGVEPDGAPDACTDASTLVIKLDRGYSDSTVRTDYAVTVAEEPRVRSVNGLPAASEVETVTPPEVSGDAEPTPGETAFDAAPEIEDGAHTGSVTTGQQVVYRIPLSWGQTLNAQAVVDRLTGTAAQSAGYFGPTLSVQILSPLLSDETSTDETASLSSTDAAIAEGVSGPLRYLNSYEGAGPYLPGDYYVVVNLAPPDEGDPFTVDYTLKVATSGTEAGEPDFGTDQSILLSSTHADSDVVHGVGPGRLLLVGGLVLVGLASLGGGMVLLRPRRPA